jgi:hypothetical protein
VSAPTRMVPASRPRLAAVPAPPAPAPVAVAPAKRSLATRVREQVVPYGLWAIARTGRPGLIGLALLFGSALFFASARLQLDPEIESLRGELDSAKEKAAQKPAAPKASDDPLHRLRSLPARAEMPNVLKQIFAKAAQAKVALDVGRYEVGMASAAGVVPHRLTLPITAPYPAVRSFIDSLLQGIPSVALADLSFDRKSISDGEVDAQLRLTVFTLEGSAAAAPEPARVLAETSEELRRARGTSPGRAALFAPHSWFKVAPAPPPPPPPPPAPPTAPPVPYAYVGTYTTGGAAVFYLSRGDKMLQARQGDVLEGVYRFEGLSGGQLAFVYLPLNIRQTLPAGAGP